MIVGSGLFGATFAHQAKQAGKKYLKILLTYFQTVNFSSLHILLLPSLLAKRMTTTG